MSLSVSQSVRPCSIATEGGTFVEGGCAAREGASEVIHTCGAVAKAKEGMTSMRGRTTRLTWHETGTPRKTGRRHFAKFDLRSIRQQTKKERVEALIAAPAGQPEN